jgi:hypothetical protein
VKSTVSSHSTKEQELPESKKVDSSSFSDNAEKIENVLILQGGGSLGAFGCRVYKSLIRNNKDRYCRRHIDRRSKRCNNCRQQK